jgi:hypothetical protein
MFDLTLGALSLQRRSAAIAIFRKTQLEDIITRQFPNDVSKAESAVVAFVRRVLERTTLDLVAVESVDTKSDRITKLWRGAREVIQIEGMLVQEVRTESLYQSFAIPPLRNRDQLRKIVQSIWPQLEDTRESDHPALDAVALGLFLQTERLFALNSPQS